METNAELMAEIKQLRSRLYELEKGLASQVDVEDELPDGDVTVLLARAGSHRIALLHEQLDEVVPMAALATVPEAPPWVLGLLNLRGQLLPVIDLQARMLRQRGHGTSQDLIAIARVGERQVGLLIQSVDDICPASTDQLEPTPADIPSAPYLHGALKLSLGTALLVSVPRLYATSDIGELVQ